MQAVEIDRAEDISAAVEDDSLADIIKTLTPQQAQALWATLRLWKPRLAEL